MSAHTGDKSRFNNDRKRKVARKAALRLLRAAIIKPVALVPVPAATN